MRSEKRREKRRSTHQTEEVVIEPFNRVEMQSGEDDFGEKIEDKVLWDWELIQLAAECES